jgi:hypothetical protein
MRRRNRPNRRGRRVANLSVADRTADSADLDHTQRIYVYGYLERLYVASGSPDRLGSADSADRFGGADWRTRPGHGIEDGRFRIDRAARANPFCRGPTLLCGRNYGRQHQGIASAGEDLGVRSLSHELRRLLIFSPISQRLAPRTSRWSASDESFITDASREKLAQDSPLQ